MAAAFAVADAALGGASPSHGYAKIRTERSPNSSDSYRLHRPAEALLIVFRNMLVAAVGILTAVMAMVAATLAAVMAMVMAAVVAIWAATPHTKEGTPPPARGTVGQVSSRM